MIHYIEKIALLLIALFFLLSFVPVVRSVQPAQNMHIVQAKAWWEGTLQLPTYMHDVAVYKGNYYSPFPPFPAFLLLPWGAVCGFEAINTALMVCLLSLWNVWLLYKIIKRELETASNTMLCWWVAAFLMGTGYWSMALQSGNVYGYSHIVAVTALLGMLYALQRNWFLVASALLGTAFLSRSMTLFYYVFFLYACYVNPRLRASVWRWALVQLPFFASILIYLFYNYLRFEQPLETGYQYVSSQYLFHAELVKQYGIFHPIYMPYNFYYMFLQGFDIEMQPPFYWKQISLNPYGTSLLVASPFVLFALQANYRLPRHRVAALGVLLILFFTLMYQNNGWVQYNTQRFSLDFLPLLLILVLQGSQRFPFSSWIKGSILYAIGLNVITVWWYLKA